MKRLLLAAAALALPAQSSLADLVITEIMFDPDAVTDANGEWFEVFNSGLLAVDIQGYSFSDLTGDFFTIPSSTIIASGQYFVFGNNGDFATNGGVNVDLDYGVLSATWALGNGIDEIFVDDSDFPSNVVDAVSYGGANGFPDPTGASLFLTGSGTAIPDNSKGFNWDVSTTPFGDGDLGTPGSGAFTVTAVPEVSTVIPLAGLLGLTLTWNRRRRQPGREPEPAEAQ